MHIWNNVDKCSASIPARYTHKEDIFVPVRHRLDNTVVVAKLVQANAIDSAMLMQFSLFC